jgi:YgiT-type zinc finger domain-containing protein
MKDLQRIRQKIIDRDYFISVHAEEEMVDDELERADIEYAIFNGRLYIVENVEAEVCSECGERYFHAKILDGVDSLLESAHKIKERLEVEVVSL